MNINKFSASQPKNSGLALYPYFYGLVVIMAIIMLLSLIFAGIFYFSEFSEAYFRPIAILISAIALFSGGFAMGRKSRGHGLLGGLILGLLFMAIVALITLFTNGDLGTLLNKTVYLMLASTIGGICGVK